MRVIAQYGQFSLQVRPQRQKGLGDGTVDITQEPIYAKFSPASEGGILENEMERALREFPFKGRFQHVDEATPVDPIYRLSVLDTEKMGWDEETRGLVEAELLRKEKITTDFFISERAPIEAPYPSWDVAEKPAFELVAGLVEMGFDLQLALDYERGFGPHREAVIEALEETMRDQQVEEITA